MTKVIPHKVKFPLNNPAFAPSARTAISQTITYLGDVLQGELGQTIVVTSRFNPLPVRQALPQLLGRSLGLLTVSLLFAAVVGILTPRIVAIRINPWASSSSSLTCYWRSPVASSTPPTRPTGSHRRR